MLRDRVVVVGVSGGIAAYKACELVRRLRDRGATVIAVLTPAACEFVTPLTFQALTGNPVVTQLWGDQQPRFELPLESQSRVGGKVEHVDVAEVADAIVVAPATADLMARLVHGEAPDALTTVILASAAPLVVAPAMDLQMWRSPATQENVRAMRARGARIVGPDEGPLASGLSGPGRLAEIAAIVEEVEYAVARRTSLAGVRVLVGAGRTEEPLDPVRVLTNRSSGRMGVALAEAARDRGADVTLVAGPMNIETPHGVATTPVRTALEMERAMRSAAEHADVVLMAAAVADYRPRKSTHEKIKRSNAPMTVELEPNPDILAGLGADKRERQVIVGFALETSNGVANARKKLEEKNADLIVLNSPERAIGSETNTVVLVESRSTVELPERSKREVAEAILDRVIEIRGISAPAKVRRRPSVSLRVEPMRTPASNGAPRKARRAKPRRRSTR